jgi:hypothetical protein
VNLADFNILASNFGHSPRTFSQGDFNYDGIVNLADFNLLASRFGTSLGAPGAAVAGTAASLLGTSRTIGFGPAAAHDEPLLEMLA